MVALLEGNCIGLRSLHEAIDTQTSGGKPKALYKDKQVLAVNLYDEKKHTVDQICEMMGVSKPTLYKYIEASRKNIL